ncbi:MAG TPA: FliM/FliN family flagellar motor switch protein [Steroidobacteraceae bacterium]|nr:FliM/FliN family flagellar motor switch protein [Steroidobacteraceae bacterium]
MADETPTTESQVISEDEVSALLAPSESDVVLYDMTAHRVSRGRLPMLDILHQAFVGFLRASLNKLVNRMPQQVTIESVDTIKIADYLAGLATPACIDVVRVKAFAGPVLFVTDPELAFVLVDRFFGGPGKSVARDPESALTPTEERFTQVVLKQVWADLALAWAPIAKLDFELVKHERSPVFVNVGAGADLIIVNRFRVDFDSGGGTFDFAIPQAALAPLADALAGSPSKAAAGAWGDWPRTARAYLNDALVRVRVEMGHAQMSLAELVQLKPGDVVPIEAPQAATLLAGQVPVLAGKFGVSRGRNALKLTGPAPRGDRNP